MTTLNAKELRSAFGAFMTGVTVVTATKPNGEMVGFTANSFTSVSLDPPLLLVCPGNHLGSFAVFEQCTHFAINVLADNQEDVSNIFASSLKDRFDQLEWSLDDAGSPLLYGCVASFSCKVHNRYEAGDHMILVGEIQSFEHDTNQDGGLGYCNKGYFTLGREQQANAVVDNEYGGIAAAIIENNDHVLIQPEHAKCCIPFTTYSGSEGARTALVNYFDRAGLAVNPGQVYSLYEDHISKTRFTVFRATAATQQTAELGEYVPIATLAKLEYPDHAQSTMMHRYVSEHRYRSYGMYVGDLESGEVHPPQT